jgi:hypothetical protein
MNTIKRIRNRIWDFVTRNKCCSCKYCYSCDVNRYRGCPYYKKGNPKETEARVKRIAEQNELWKSVLGADENEKTEL